MANKGQIGVTTENIFPVIKQFLYSDHEIFLREMVSNAVDATQKVKTLAERGALKGELGDLTVHITLDADNVEEFQKAQGELSSALGRLIAIGEAYPDLKANENFRELQVQLEGTENRINEARNKYNSAVQAYNKRVRKFPNNLFAGIFGFSTMKKFEAEAGAEKAPEVKF